MELIVEHVDVWAATVKDEPGGLATKLSVLAEAGADLDFVIARRSPEKPGEGVVFVAPLQGDAEVEAAGKVGFVAATGLHSIRVEGPNRPGLGARLSQRLADAGINLRGMSAAVLGARFIMYLALDTVDDARRATEVLKQASV